MCDEVICLSSDENESAPASERSVKTAVKKETNARKRKLPDVDSSNSNVNLKKHKFENIKCSSPQSRCSKDFDRIENKKKVIKPQLVVKTKIQIPHASEDVFQNFMKTCLSKRDDEDTKKVLHNLEKLYNKLSPFYKSNDELRLFINNCHEKIIKGLSKDIYTPTLELYTEIKNHVQFMDHHQATTSNAEDNIEEIEVSKEDMKKIKLLEKSIKECTKKIKELEEKEVNFDDDKDSAYIQEDKYKKRLIQLCNMLSKISGDKTIRKQILKKKIRRKDIPDEMTGISSVDEAIIRFVNSDIEKINQLKYLETQRCADHIKMPEYLDILKCIQKCNNDSNLDLSKDKMNKLAKKAFQAVGNFLKKKRMDETKFYIQSLLDDNDGSEDPAMKDTTLNQKLQKNRKEGERKLEEIFKKYVDKQEGLQDKDTVKPSDDSISSEDDSETDNTENEDLDKTSSSATEEKSSNGINDEKLKTSSNMITSEKNKDKIAIDKKLSNNSENRIIIDEDDDVLVINNDLDDNMEAVDPLDINNMSAATENKVLTEPTNEILQVNIERQSQIASPTRITEDSSASDISTEKVVDASKVNETKASFIKVCAFAKPPPAWEDPASPEKAKPKLKVPIQQTLQHAAAALRKPECIDLTKEREKRLPISRMPTFSTRSINPLANLNCALPKSAKRVVIVKNVINNYNVPFCVDGVKSPKNAHAVNRPRQNSVRGGGGGGDGVNVSQRSNDADGKSVKSVWLSKDKGGADKRPYIK